MQPYELLVRFRKGIPAGASVRYLVTDETGKDHESDPVPLPEVAEDSAFSGFATQFSVAIIAERDELKSQLSESEAKAAKLQAEIDRMLAEYPYDCRKLSVNAFTSRMSNTEMLSLFSSEDAGVMQVAAMLKQWDKEGWHIALDSAEFGGAMTVLVAAGVVTAKRVEELARDATRTESVG